MTFTTGAGLIAGRALAAAVWYIARRQEASPMMGSRGTTDGDEYDAFCRRSRHLLSWRRGELHRIKKRFAKRQRRLSRLRLKGCAVA